MASFCQRVQKKHTFVYQDNVCFFKRNLPFMASEIASLKPYRNKLRMIYKAMPLFFILVDQCKLSGCGAAIIHRFLFNILYFL